MAEDKTEKKGTLKKRVSPDTLLQEYASGITIKEIGKKYNCSRENIRLMITNHDKERYIKIKKNFHKKIREEKWEKWEIFRQLIIERGYIPSREETEKLIELPNPSFYLTLRSLAIKRGYITQSLYEKDDRIARKREVMLAYLKETAARLGRTPSNIDLAADGKYHASSYAFYFGSLSAAQQLACNNFNKRGNTPERALLRPTTLSRNQCIEELINLGNQLGHKPTWKEVKTYGSHHHDTYRQKIGERISDYVTYQRQGKQEKVERNFTETEKKMMLDYLKEFAQRLGHTPGISDLKQEKKYSLAMYRACFGKLRAAQKQAGLEHLRPELKTLNIKINRGEEKEVLIVQLADLAKKLGHTPSRREIQKEGKISSSSYRTYFGSISKAQKAAGLTPRLQHGRIIRESGHKEEIPAGSSILA